MTEARQKKRRINLYDAVAGRAYTAGFLSHDSSSTAQQFTTPKTAAPPEEILYHRPRAPPRYEENDTYFQHRHLRSDQSLPDSDLLKAIHAYTADYYARTTTDQGKVDERSLDETALIAIGILLEESAKKCLGKTGDLALAEPE